MNKFVKSDEPPDYWILDGENYCRDCTARIIKDFRRQGIRPRNKEDREGVYPKGPYSDEESDSPVFCASGSHCLNALTLDNGSKVGMFFENPLTPEGEEYVLEEYGYLKTLYDRMLMDFYDI